MMKYKHKGEKIMKLKNMITAVLTITALTTGSVYAGDVDILLNKLVEKKILTSEEAKGLSDEMKKDGEKEKKVTAGAVKEGFELPKWIKIQRLKAMSGFVTRVRTRTMTARFHVTGAE